MRNIILILSINLSLFSCNDSKNENTFPQNIVFTVISNDILSGNGSEGIVKSNMVINNTSDWQNLLTQMNSVNNVSDNFTETTIDFDSYLLIAVFLEVKSNGWEVKITNITENESSLVVSTNETEFVSLVMTQPYSIVKIRRTEKTIKFE
ncbi:protease complex subunit PrcB family protein [Polaribacter sp. HL-MS24]|uniref:protease complex subunit PrcB family protein n=1 Tax=Polaribacter sp. HL-MS24 TaxID=3077735 RepID=UPI002934B1D0|nr:protease complex subunit PrcB family protein [Polaribacter sp. HL-MS24]WOC39956.1 protease complex subunit PrcB family protein [Polaribacter sp. HL-MS24]